MEKTNLIINSSIDIGGNLELETNGKGRHFVSRFIEAGVAHYEQFGDVLITKETLDKFINSMVGCPVIIKHKDITDENADKERVGVVSRVWFNEFDGWYWCEGIIWDKQAIDLIKNQGWNVSCTYDFESDKLPKTHNGKKVDMEFTDGEFLHLALVPNPRYERANIVINSKDEFLFTIYNESDQDLDDTSTERWITIHPNGEDAKGRAICIPKGKTVSEVMKEKFAAWAADSKDQQKLFDVKDYKSGISDYKVEKKTKDLMKKYGDNLDSETAKELIKEKYGYKDFTKKEDKKNLDDPDKDELVTLQKADTAYIKKQKETDERWQKAIKETAKKEGWDKQNKENGEKANLDIKKTTVKMKSGKTKEIEYVEDIPKGYKKLEGAMTAPLGYTWYTNGKSLLGKERHSILVKDKSENSLINGLDEILTDYKPIKEDLPILNGLKDILTE